MTRSMRFVAQKLAAFGITFWNHLPLTVRESFAGRSLGRSIHYFVRKYSERGQSTGTYFLRNLPLMTTLAGCAAALQPLAPIRFGIIGCSDGAEVYSFLWVLRKALPSASFTTVALDISPGMVESARQGRYTPGAFEFRKGLSKETIDQLFDLDGDQLKIKSAIAEGIRWLVADATDPNLVNLIGRQDILLANNFMVHMKPADAKPCMLGLLRLVRPGGFFVCRGVDLDIRESVALQAGLQPIIERIEEIHGTDPDLDAPKDWPWKYWGLEPFDRGRKNWQARYTSIFRVPNSIK